MCTLLLLILKFIVILVLLRFLIGWVAFLVLVRRFRLYSSFVLLLPIHFAALQRKLRKEARLSSSLQSLISLVGLLIDSVLFSSCFGCFVL